MAESPETHGPAIWNMHTLSHTWFIHVCTHKLTKEGRDRKREEGRENLAGKINMEVLTITF